MKQKDSFVTRSVRNNVGAISEVYFPTNDFGAPDWQETEMVGRTLLYIDTLPPGSRAKLRLLFFAIEWLAPLLFAGVGRFSKRSLAFRKRAVARWHDWNFIVFRLLSDAIKAQITMTYCSHGSVQRYIGVWKSCERDADPYPLETRKGYLEDFADKDAAARGEVHA